MQADYLMPLQSESGMVGYQFRKTTPHGLMRNTTCPFHSRYAAATY